jgi:hypothetical protein
MNFTVPAIYIGLWYGGKEMDDTFLKTDQFTKVKIFLIFFLQKSVMFF